MAAMASMGVVTSSIRRKLTSSFEPLHLQIINESSKHNVPAGSETHFKVIIVSDKFAGQPLLQKHRMVNKVLEEELQGSVHALSIVAKSGEEWQRNSQVEPTPACRGGFGK